MPDYDTWYSSIFAGISDWFSGILEVLAIPFRSIAEGISGLWSDVNIGIGDIIGGITSNISGLWNNLSISFGDVTGGLGNIFGGIGDIGTGITNIPSKIMEVFTDGLKLLFVPRDNFFSEKISDYKLILTSKIPIIGQIGELYTSLFSTDYTQSEPPEFNINYKGTEMSIIDFSLVNQYRVYLHGIILAIAYTFFIIKTAKQLPSIIRGF